MVRVMIMAEETMAERLKRLREEKGLSKYRLARLSSISEAYIYRLEAGDISNPRRDTLLTLAKGLGVSLSEIAGENLVNPKDTWQLVETSLKAYIPVYAEVCAGPGIISDPIDYVACTRSKPAPESLRAYRVKGLCLDPEIHDGDTLIVDTALSPENNDLVIVVVNEEVALWRYRQDDGGHIWLEDNNGICCQYSSNKCSCPTDSERCPPDGVILHGVVTEFTRKKR